MRQHQGVIMLDVDMMLGERDSGVFGFIGGWKLVFMQDVLAMPHIPQPQPPVVCLRLHG